MEKRNRRILLFLAVLVLVPVLHFVCLVREARSDAPLTFTPALWEARPYRRHRMLESLSDQYKLVGMTRGEILELLSTHYTAGPPGDLIYIIGWGDGPGRQVLHFYLRDGLVYAWDQREYDVNQ